MSMIPSTILSIQTRHPSGKGHSNQTVSWQLLHYYDHHYENVNHVSMEIEQ